jgi:hypothetical protein
MLVGANGGLVTMSALPADEYDLGACCACGEPGPTVRNLLMLPLHAPHPGTGWGCVVCGLPSDGAVAVVCDACLEAGRQPTEVCCGYPLERARIARAAMEYRGPFGHDLTKHGGER